MNPLLARDPYVMLAGAAVATTRIGLGTLLENPVLIHPSAAASAIATVDEISEGRAVLGYGAGPRGLAGADYQTGFAREVAPRVTEAA